MQEVFNMQSTVRLTAVENLGQSHAFSSVTPCFKGCNEVVTRL